MKDQPSHLKPIFGLIALSLLFVTVFLFGCSNSERASPPVERPSPPGEYADLENPLDANKSNREAGKEIYQTHCVSCHGEGGKGDGSAASSMDPKPSDLTSVVDSLSDAYLFWRVSEGGGMEPFNSGMKPWKSVLSEEERWQVILFIKTLGR